MIYVANSLISCMASRYGLPKMSLLSLTIFSRITYAITMTLKPIYQIQSLRISNKPNRAQIRPPNAHAQPENRNPNQQTQQNQRNTVGAS